MIKNIESKGLVEKTARLVYNFKSFTGKKIFIKLLRATWAFTSGKAHVTEL